MKNGIFTFLCLTATQVIAADITVSVSSPEGRQLAEVAVILTPNNQTVNRSAEDYVIDQVNKQFVPRISVIRSGTQIRFPNHDDIHHHVYSFSPAKTFELPLYKGETAEPVLFDKPGLITLACNIHDWMIAYIYVVDTPWFAVTDANGDAMLDDLPPGTYNLRLMHPLLEAEVAETINVSVNGNNTLAIEAILQPEKGLRRLRRRGRSYQ